MYPRSRGLLSSTALTRIGTITAGIILLNNSAYALPQNGSVSGGSASIVQTSPTQLDITQNSDRAVIDWHSFSIGSNETTAFHQPNSGSIAVNRVTGADPSQVMGRLTANGQVVLVNPNGILFGKGSQVNVGGLVATTSSVSTANAMAGNMVFDQGTPSPAARVINEGTITAAQGGLVALVAPGVINNGVIQASLGKISLASGDKWTLDLYGDHLVNFAVNDQLASQMTSADGSTIGVTQAGSIIASAGKIELSANIAKGIVSNAINMSGILEATSVSSQGGTIVLNSGNSGVAISGTADVSGTTGGSIAVTGDSIIHQGTLNASGTAGAGGQINISAASLYMDTTGATNTATGTSAGGNITVTSSGSLYSAGTHTATSSQGTGGTVTMTAPTLNLVGTKIDASGAKGGGTINIGGGLHGAGPIAHAIATTVDGGVTLKANAMQSGNGGQINIWSDDTTTFGGTVSAKGGATSGNGGNVEVSSAATDTFAGIVDASAPNGTSGHLLLDPKTITIDSSGALFPQFNLVNPNSVLGGSFGSVSVVLSNGNIVVTDPTSTLGLGPAFTGAAYLFNGLTGQLISTLTGTVAGDKVGTNVTALTNGNFVVSESTWNGGLGAATWGNGSLGIAGNVSAANSLIGSTTGDNVGLSVTALTSGNYVVGSSNWNGGKGAATWGSGTLGITGTVAVSNSLIGSTAGDKVGLNVTALANGNYVVGSPNWAGNKGAATWGNGTIGISGVVSAGNSLVGSTVSDEVGLNVTALTNGNYVVGSPNWNGNKGAATWGSGSLGVSGSVTVSNSLIGSTAGDEVGLSVTALTNGNYVVGSPDWSSNKGAATWADGSVGLFGAVTTGNSLTGTLGGDKVGTSVLALANGNYVVGSPNWSLGKGAATWGSGASGFTGTISAANSLVGSALTDQVGLILTALTNGNYVVGSPDWNGAKGAATWGSGTLGLDGTISTSNSLIGNTLNDQVGLHVTALANGNYVVGSPLWNGTLGAASWGSGTLGLDGTVSTSNSLTGSLLNDEVGLHVTALTNGNYVVGNPLWAGTLGAATWGSGTLGIDGTVSSSNSLVGSLIGDLVGSSVTALSTGAYVVGSFGWNGGLGAATYGIGTAALTGTVSALNSIIGSGIQVLPNVGVSALGSTGNFLVSLSSIGNGYVAEGISNPNQMTYGAAVLSSMTVSPSYLTQTLNTGTAVTLQADDDIIVNSAITTSAGGAGGALTLQAGRSLLLNANITTDNGALTLIANDTAADGVVNLSRDPGNGVITMAGGTTLNAGTGTVTINMKTGAGITNAASNGITLNNVSGSTISVIDENLKTLTLNGTLAATASGNSLVLSTGVLTNVAGAGALNPGAGRYLLYTTSPLTDTLNGIAGFAYHYGLTYANSAPANYTTGGNYSLYGMTPTLTVTIGSGSKVYGSANPALSYSTSGLLSGDTLSGALSTTPNLSTTATTTSGVGSYSISASNSLTSSLGYNIVVTNGTLTVTPAPLTITANNATKVYGAANPSLSATYSGLVNGDSSGVVSNMILSTTATSASNVGSYTITAGNGSASNYAITYVNGTLAVTPAALTIGASNSTKVYGAANPAFSASYIGLVNGDSSVVVTGLSFSTTATSASNVGSYSISASGGAASNYTINYGSSGTLAVTPAALTIGANNSSKVYGAANPAFSASYTGLVNGDAASVVSGLSFSTTATSASNVGSYSISALGGAASNYTINYGPSGTLSVTPAALTITANNSSKIYGTANPAFSASYTGLVNGDTTAAISGLVLGTIATSASTVGSYAITASGASDANYTISYGATGTLTIGQAALTITANNASRTYGANNPAFSATYSGLVNGDGSGIVTNLLLGTSATSASNVGNYAITANATATNYAITYVNGTLAVIPAPLTISANNATKVYGSGNPTFSASYTGLVNGDTSTAVSGLTLSTAATSASNVGSYAITGSGATASNYSIAYGPSGTLSITPAALTITTDSATRSYGSANPVFTASFNGLVNGDSSVSISGLTLSTTATQASNVGTYAITGSGGANANYTISYGPSGTLAITPAALTISANNSSKVYGSGNPAFSASYNGLLNGDTSTAVSGLSLASTATSGSSVGTYAITASGGSATNYTIGYGQNGTLTVTPAALTISTGNANRVYGGSNPAFSASYTGLVNGDTSAVVSSVSLSTVATSTSNVGSYAINATGGAASNYTISYGSTGNLTITPAALTITPNNSSRLYGQNNAFTATYSGLTAGDTSAAVSGLALSSPATGSTGVGTYAITASAGTAPNYTISYGPSATLTITPAPLTITPNNATRLMGDTNNLTATFTGLAGGDSASAIAGVMLSTTASSTSSVGNYPIMVLGGSNPNYTITYGPNGTLSVVNTLPTPPSANPASNPMPNIPTMTQPDPNTAPQMTTLQFLAAMNMDIQNSHYSEFISQPTALPTMFASAVLSSAGSPNSTAASLGVTLGTATNSQTTMLIASETNSAVYTEPFIEYEGAQTDSNQLVCLKLNTDTSSGGDQAQEVTCAAPLSVQGF